MAFFDWDESLSVGIALVDEDHRQLIDLVNQLHDGMGANEEKAIVGTVLNALADYVVYHFKREERVMAACGYADLERHRSQHEAFADQVQRWERHYREDRSAADSQKLLVFLKDWLARHISREDRAFAPSVAGHEKAATEAAERVPRLNRAARDGGLDWRRMRVMVVDDNVNFRRVTRTILQSVQVAEIEEAENGAEARALMHEFLPDVVLCDWRMEEMDGIAFVRSVREGGGKCAGVPIIMMTGFGDDDFRLEALSAGVTEFMEKPITARGVLLSVARAMAR
jgi:hemerythrin-like metal-binding protein